MVAVPAVPALPVESFTVVMATGIVAVAAHAVGHPAVGLVLAGLAGGGLAVLVGGAALARLGSGEWIARGAHPVDRAFGLFGFVAGIDVVAAQFGPGAADVVAALAATALVAWGVLLIGLSRAVRTCASAAARGSWLLVAVATQSLALIAARLAASGRAPGTLVVLAAALWVAGALGYITIVRLVVGRMLRVRWAPALLTPDMWVLMGASAIAVVAGGSLVDALDVLGASAGLVAVGAAAVFGCWVVATAWIPLLVAAELRRARRRPPGYEPARWSTVFPLGMYSVACSTVAVAAPALREGLQTLAAVVFWVALIAWCATAVGMGVNCWAAFRARRPG